MTRQRALTTVGLLAVLLAACGDSEASAEREGQPSAATQQEDPPQAARTAPGAADDFEGVITSVTTDADGERLEMRLWIKGARVRLEVSGLDDEQRGFLIRDQQGRMLSVMEDSRQYVYLPHLEGEAEPLGFTPLGRSETVAGYPCTYYRISDPNGLLDGDEACVTTALGFVSFGAGQALDEHAIRAQFPEGFLILKQRDADGAEHEVTSIERRPLSDDLFQPPPGYTELRMPNTPRHP